MTQAATTSAEVTGKLSGDAALAQGSSSAPVPLFEGFFLGGFECSCHRLQDGKRLDLLASTGHDQHAVEDYRRLRHAGLCAARDGAPWARAERQPRSFDFSSFVRVVAAARETKTPVIWDLMHFGWPDDVDVFSSQFPPRFAAYARAFARWLASETDALPFIAPINEISFLSWAGGDVRCMNPFEAARGLELKIQLVRATIEAIDAILLELPHARFLQPEPLIHIVAAPDQPKTWRRVESDELLQYQAWDMLVGRVFPWLGGHPRYLDIVGVNYYPDNQFMLDGTTVSRGDPRYRPFSQMLMDVHARYGRPLIISETGSEGSHRADWLRYVADECAAALVADCELHGVTLYPLVDHPGWLDDRHCDNGLFGYADERGHRPVHEPLLFEIHRQAPRLRAEQAGMLSRRSPAVPRVA
jgi:hypothetical protein